MAVKTAKKNSRTNTKVNEKQSTNHAKEQLVDVKIRRKQDTKAAHPHVITESFDDKNVSVGLTTQPKKGKGHNNYELANDPLGGNKKSYMRKQGTVAPKKDYGSLSYGKMTEKDYNKAKDIGKRAKEKHLNKKK